ncbi:hypothetical protein ABBQ38_011767 [Trebouxia sp. C0009 RCD-2024]
MDEFRLWGTGWRTAKCELVAAYAGVPIVKAPYTPGLSSQTPRMLGLRPDGKVSSNACRRIAIARYLASLSSNQTLYPQSEDPSDTTRALIDAWVDWATSLDTATKNWVEPMFGQAPQQPSAVAAAKAQFEKALQTLDIHLAFCTYLVGETITLADLVVVSHLLLLYLTVFDASMQKQYPIAHRYIQTILSKPTTVQVYGSQLQPPQKACSYNHNGGSKWGEGPSPLKPISHLFGQPWSGDRVRSAFIEFFQTKGHTHVPSSSVVPHNDPTLLFANAGMNQFKPIFLGTVDPNSNFAKLKSATDSQKCIRAGGKHNDLDDVGKDVYHHTFFEMLGNWSFGDYFKKEAITYAWELLTSVYKLDGERLYATYFGGEEKQGLKPDEEARQIWLQFLPAKRILPFGTKDNFWEMGDQGPCGPCTEIHYDRVGGRDAAHLVNMDDPNVLEIWNLVFIQFNREADASLKSLPAKHVDTGMGMERVTSVLQNKMSNYATDIFAPIFAQIQKVTGARPYTDKVGAEDKDGMDMAYRVVADHIRTLCFAIADGARPGSEGRDYVLRRVLRRGVRYGQDTLKAPAGFFHGLVDSVVASMGHFYPELVKAREHIISVISEEEVSFNRTLDKGIARFKKAAAAAKAQGQKDIDSKDAFEMWDTYGFPVDLTQLMAEEQGLVVSLDGFNQCMQQQRERSRAGAKSTAASSLKFQAEATAHLQKSGVARTLDAPKYEDKAVEAKVMAILSSSGFVDSSEGCQGPVGLVLDTTNFYAEQGGQVADIGCLASSSAHRFDVQDTQVAAGYVLHVGQAEGQFAVGEKVMCHRDQQRRQRILPNHTFTHVLNYALREVLGDEVHQKGSIVLPDKLRFDFSHNGVIEGQRLGEVEAMCRQAVQQEQRVYSKEVALEDAQKINGLRAVFGEVYPDPVRVVSIGKPVEDLLASPAAESNRQYSVEFCGGTHLQQTGDAKAFALISEEGIAKGIRRIVAVTGQEAAEAIKEGEALADQLAAAQKLQGQDLEKEVAALKQTVDPAPIPAAQKASLRDQLAALQKRVLEGQKKASAANKQRATQAAVADADAAVAAGQKFGVIRVDVGLDPKALLEAWNAIQKQHEKLPVIMFSTDHGKGKVLAYTGVPADLAKAMPAGNWLKAALDVLGGKGGGKPTNAQGQGPNVDKLSEAMSAAKAHAESILS